MKKQQDGSPLSCDDWEYEADVETRYECLHDEYGDLTCLLPDYVDYNYQEYLELHQGGSR